jgi:hypothetical protein
MIRNAMKLLLNALIASLVLSTAVSAAQARRLELSDQRIRLVWSEEEPLKVLLSGGFIIISCSVTMEGSFHSRTMSKVSGQLIGYITSARLRRPCTGGEAWILNGTETLPGGSKPTSLPWHVRYDSFSGPLPRITRIRLQVIGAAYLSRALETGCLVSSTTAQPAIGLIELDEAGKVTGLTPEVEETIPNTVKLEGSLPCAEVAFEGRGRISVQGTTTGLRLRLVQ